MDIKNYAFIMRGLPGSGKSTLAAEFAYQFDAIICSADDFFVEHGDGVYKFNPALIGVAHNTCRNRFAATLVNRANAVVDNTNVKPGDYKFYLDAAKLHGYKVYFVEPKTTWAMDINECFIRNTHGVPLAVLEKMHDSLSNTRTLPTNIKSISSVEEVE